jgi:RNA polymerase sigma-70 factor (ECF subfamily)
MHSRDDASVTSQIQQCLRSGRYREALEHAASNYVDTVFRYCFRVLHEDMARARDVTQQVFEEVCKGLVNYRGEAAVKTWIMAIAHNQCLKDIDTRHRQQAIVRDHQARIAAHVHADAPRGAEATVLSQEWLTRLQQALGQLDPEMRSILVMRFGVGVAHELSTAEIAQVLGISRAAAYRKLDEALQRVRRMLDHDQR